MEPDLNPGETMEPDCNRDLQDSNVLENLWCAHMTNPKLWDRLEILDYEVTSKTNIQLTIGFAEYSSESDAVSRRDFDPSQPIKADALILMGMDFLQRIYSGTPRSYDEVHFKVDCTTRFTRRIRTEFRNSIVPSYPHIQNEVHRRQSKKIIETALRKALLTLPASDIMDAFNWALVHYTIES